MGAILYFAPAYAGHLAEHWEILLFVAGLILIGVEIFVLPGFGVCGISGIVCVVLSLAFSMVDNVEFYKWDGTISLVPIIKPLGIVVLSTAAAVFGSIWLVRKLFPTSTFDHIALRQEMKADEGFTGVVSGLEIYIGQTVTVFADMRPGGKVKTSDGKIHEAALKFGGFASKGEVLKVLQAEQGRLYCDK